MDAAFPEPDVTLVRQLIQEQLPAYEHHAVTPVAIGGWDNRTFHLGNELLVRIPSALHYVSQVEKEQRWLPFLSRHIALAIPEPVAKGLPSSAFPYPWSIYKWLPGETLSSTTHVDQKQLATSLAGFLRELQAVSTADAPCAGAHCFFRGAHLSVYDAETQQAIEALSGIVVADAASAVWKRALNAPYTGEPVWFHGDIAPGNLLMTNGQLSAVIDFGCCGVGDPACDLAFAWTDLPTDARECFLGEVGADANMTSRAMGWALWKALITAAACDDSDDPHWHRSINTIRNVFQTH